MAIIKKSFSDLVDFSRGSKSTCWDKDGILREADIDEPRFDYDPVTGEALGLLLEGQATNVALTTKLNDSRFPISGSDGYWIYSGLEGVEDYPTDKFPNAVVVKPIEVSEQGLVTSSPRINIYREASHDPDSPRTNSVYIKAGAVSRVTFRFGRAGGGRQFNATFNLATGEVGSVGIDSINPSIVPVGGGWYHISIHRDITSVEAVSASSFNIEYEDFLPDTPVTLDTPLLYLSSPMMTNQLKSTSFIPTDGSEVTRARDFSTIPSGDWYSPDKGTLVVTSATPEGELVAKLGDVEIYSDSNEAKEYRASYSTTNNATELELGVGTFKSIQYYNRVLP